METDNNYSVAQETENYKLLAENISDVIWVYNIAHQKLVYISPSLEHQTNLSLKQAMQQTLENAYTPETAEQARKVLDESLAEFRANPYPKKYYRFEVLQVFQPQHPRWIENIIHYRYNKQQEIEMVGVARDIDQRKRTELELVEYKERLENLVTQRTQELEIAQKQQIKAIIEGEENERARLSQEIHDGLGPLFSSLKMLMQGIRRVDDADMIKEFAHRSQDVFEEILQAVTEISSNLSPLILRKFGLYSGLKTFIEKSVSLSEIDVCFNCDLEKRLSALIEITLYRVITELINNSAKHSKANKIELSIKKKLDYIIIIYTDNGIGFNFDETISKGKGLGLFNMQNRIRNINGTIKFESHPDRGTSAYIKVLDIH